jgi:hypothetical protein
MKAEEAGEADRVSASRRRVEERIDEIRGALHEDFGLVPRSAAWVIPTVGFVVGFGLAVRAFRRRRHRRALG